MEDVFLSSRQMVVSSVQASVSAPSVALRQLSDLPRLQRLRYLEAGR